MDEITWDSFDETTRIWMRVLAQVPDEAVVRALRLDLNTGVVTLMGAGRDRVVGHIGEEGGEGGKAFSPLKIWGPDQDPGPIPYETGYARGIGLAVYYCALHVLVGDLPLRWDDYDGLCWVTQYMDESIDAHTTDLGALRDGILHVAAQCWAVEFIRDLEERIPAGVTREASPRAVRYLTGGCGRVEIIPAPDEHGLLDVNILRRDGGGLRHHLAYGTPEADDALERAARFISDHYGNNKKEDGDAG